MKCQENCVDNPRFPVLRSLLLFIDCTGL